MQGAVVAQKGPYAVEVEAGGKYFWCACGRSRSQPFCDGSHAGTGILPVLHKPTESGKLWFCGCKQTRDRPFCDGSHNLLEDRSP